MILKTPATVAGRAWPTSEHAFAVFLLISVALPSAAADYKNEFDKKVKATQNVGALGDNLAGDAVNFYNGTTSFSTTDVSIPGNNALSVALGRTYNVEYNRRGAFFGDWELDVPHLSTIMTDTGGWVVNSASPQNRCNVTAATGAPPAAVVQTEGGFRTHAFQPNDYWHGYTLHVPGGNQAMLFASGANTQRPTTGGPYPWTTNQNWWLSCLTVTANSAGGEAFIAVSPDGTKYRFDWLSVRSAEQVEATESLNPDPNGGPPYIPFVLYRAQYLMLPTRVEDRFGNWVQYNWEAGLSGRLNSITSSDGRSITLGYVGGAISSVTDGTRTWQYSYTNGSLTQVTLPDGSTWNYGFSALSAVNRPEPECLSPNAPLASWDCYGGGGVSNVATPAHVIHPSGARVDFIFDLHYQASNSTGFYGYYPLSIKEKTLSGPRRCPNRKRCELKTSCRASIRIG